MKYYPRIVVAAAALTFGLVPATAQAATTIQSSAYDIFISLRVLPPLVSVGLGPLTSSGGSAPGFYSDTDSLLSIGQDLNIGISSIAGLRERIGTGLITTAAQSPYTGIGGGQSGSARAEVDDLSSRLGLYSIATGFGNLLSISADTVISRSAVAAPGGVASATGFTQLEGLRLTGTLLGGTTINGALFVNPDPNYVLFSLGVLGNETLKIILNEQIKSDTTPGDGAAGISTNAIHIIFADLNVAGIGLLRGDIIVAHSQARIVEATEAVPEPAIWAQMIVGFGLAGTVVRRRRRLAA